VLACLPCDDEDAAAVLAAAEGLAAALDAALSVVRLYPRGWRGPRRSPPDAWHLESDEPLEALRRFAARRRVTHLVLPAGAGGLNSASASCILAAEAPKMTDAGLERFVAAQDPVYDAVRRELADGRKRSHWMWFVFPQIAGLGSSATARLYALASLDEARAYLAHPVLGARLRECVRLTLLHAGESANELLGSPDDLKYRSSLTLFAEAAPDEALFRDALAAFYRGEPDGRTLALLRAKP
jgi:uncharacterized protein (DUF1810 family)